MPNTKLLIALSIFCFASNSAFTFDKNKDWDAEYKKANILKAVKRDAEAVEIYKRGCASNHIYSCESLGNSYLSGIGVAKSEEMGRKYIKKTCDLGYGKGCFDYIYKEDANGYSINPAAVTMPYLQKGCDLRHARSCTIMGTYYVSGAEIKQDFPIAASYFEKGCSLKDADSCDLMGKFYIKGLAVAPSLPKALEYFKQACALGNSNSCQTYDKYSKN